VFPLAHIGGIPVEEWLPFVAPLVAVYVYVRRRERRRRSALQRVIEAGARLDTRMTAAILERWRAADHAQLSAEQVPLLYPPGPDGASSGELARRLALDEHDVRGRLEDLIEAGYLERAQDPADGQERVWLTVEGFAAANIVEDAVLADFAAASAPAGPSDGSAVAGEREHVRAGRGGPRAPTRPAS